MFIVSDVALFILIVILWQGNVFVEESAQKLAHFRG